VLEWLIMYEEMGMRVNNLEMNTLGEPVVSDGLMRVPDLPGVILKAEPYSHILVFWELFSKYYWPARRSFNTESLDEMVEGIFDPDYSWPTLRELVEKNHPKP